jgi:hypothetical protein
MKLHFIAAGTTVIFFCIIVSGFFSQNFYIPSRIFFHPCLAPVSFGNNVRSTNCQYSLMEHQVLFFLTQIKNTHFFSEEEGTENQVSEFFLVMKLSPS